MHRYQRTYREVIESILTHPRGLINLVLLMRNRELLDNLRMIFD